MKKILSSVLVCVMLLSCMLVLASCGNTLSGTYEDETGFTSLTFKGKNVEIEVFGASFDATYKIDGDTITEDNLKTVLNAYVNSATDSTSVALARAILNPDSFRTKTVTVEKMMASTDFANWTDEEKANDSRLCVEIIMDLLGLMESLGGMDVSGGMDAALDLVDQFESLGATMDIMKQTSCINGLPELLIEGLVKHEMLSTYMKPSTAHSINDLVQNNNKSYADCMKQIAVNIKWAINAFGGVQ